MGYLPPLRSISRSIPTAEDPCLAAYDRDLDYLCETLRRLGAPPRDINDLAQEVFIVLHRNWSILDTTRPLRPYLFGVAFRIVCAHRRRHAREIPTPALEIEDDHPSPEGSLQSEESRALLLAALDRIPLPRRAVVVMHDLDGVPVAEISERLSISLFGTYARLRKARKELAVAVKRLSKARTRK